MGVFERNLKQDITHWTATPDGYGGFTFGSPSTQKGRWVNRNVLFNDAAGEEVVSNSIVNLSLDVAEGDYLYEGKSTEADPTTLDGAARVRRFNKFPDLRKLNTVRKAFL